MDLIDKPILKEQEDNKNNDNKIDEEKDGDEDKIIFDEEPIKEINTEGDLAEIKGSWDRLEINKLKFQIIFEKISKIKFDKLEVLSINEAEIKSLDFLTNDNFKSLIILELKGNKLCSLDQINKVPFSDLKILDLSSNQISSISEMEKAPFKNLEILILSNNHINDNGIKIIADGSFTKISKLDLSNNKKIESISTLADNDTLHNLEFLYLNDNSISDISILNKGVFKNLKELQLSNNKIQDLKVFESAPFHELTELLLYGNEIKFIASLTKVNFEKLKILSLGKNKIENIEVLKEAKFSNLEKLDLFDNQILEIDILKNVPFKNSIQELDISFNNLQSVKILNDETFPSLKKEGLKFEGNKDLNYGEEIIEKIYKKYGIKYTYESII